jgi:hypothetical protein
VAKQVPLVTAELGEDDCKGNFVDGYLTFASSHGISYMAWAWDAWTQCTALITTYQGAPTAYGFIYREHLAGLAILNARAANAAGQTTPTPRAPATSLAGVWIAVIGLLIGLLAVGVLLLARRRRGTPTR